MKNKVILLIACCAIASANLFGAGSSKREAAKLFRVANAQKSPTLLREFRDNLGVTIADKHAILGQSQYQDQALTVGGEYLRAYVHVCQSLECGKWSQEFAQKAQEIIKQEEAEAARQRVIQEEAKRAEQMAAVAAAKQAAQREAQEEAARQRAAQELLQARATQKEPDARTLFEQRFEQARERIRQEDARRDKKMAEDIRKWQKENEDAGQYMSRRSPKTDFRARQAERRRVAAERRRQKKEHEKQQAGQEPGFSLEEACGFRFRPKVKIERGSGVR